ncbi:N-acetylmuramoyl-L-alanine amidase [Zongyangia hominis]|uniref:N-acetylmuramoyl-L-alanine amidase n=1 Tax=Zongyangia hominis TaxID=2763677 RepID=A0A926EAQ5_9FIRM|nr:N-acetylmuramoyl-L-alanine amidase [Zongyangia hominis]MBC8569588.1 N-acetylmuramoyl-L-alanine amidase [Zongyangia hominis]
MKLKFLKLVVPITTLAVVVFCMSAGHIVERNTVMADAQPQVSKRVIVDAGHGGMDGGAVGVDGIVEKDINLAIALKVRDQLVLNGYEVIMTRDSDISIHDPDKTSVRQQKVSDIKNRMKIIEENPDAIFVSIHQNQFGVSKYFGAQMFFSPNNPESELLSQTLQDTFKELLQPENERVHKKADKNLYLLYHAKSPAVLIECGFLSNPDEARKLTTAEYQNEVAFAITSAINRYFSPVDGAQDSQTPDTPKETDGNNSGNQVKNNLCMLPVRR